MMHKVYWQPNLKTLSFEEAAVVPTAGLEALHYLKEANIQHGGEVLIIGAGGSIGTFAIQLAKHLGAEVTAVDSGQKRALIRSLGADHFIDYTREEYTNSAETFDLIIDVVGKHSVSRRMGLLKQKGVYFLAFARPSNIALAWWTNLTSGKKLKIQSASQKKEDLIFLSELLATGKIRSVLGKCFPLEEMVDAHKYVESGEKQGNIAISVGH